MRIALWADRAQRWTIQHLDKPITTAEEAQGLCEWWRKRGFCTAIIKSDALTPAEDLSCQLAEEIERTMRNERSFWDDIACRTVSNSESINSETVIVRAIRVADSLLEERRQRFPVKEKD